RAAGQVAPADVAIAPVTDDADPGELLGLLGPVACPHHQRVARRAPGVRARAVVRAEEPSAGAVQQVAADEGSVPRTVLVAVNSDAPIAHPEPAPTRAYRFCVNPSA